MIDFKNIPTPCYLLHEDRLRSNLELIKRVKEKAGVNIILAFKGFAMWSSFGILNEYGFTEAAASSPWEARLAHEGMGQKAHTYSPAYTEEHFEDIIKHSQTITFNSLNQYNRFKDKIKSTGVDTHIALRINPEFSEVETDLYNPCAVGSRLGILSTELPSLPEGVDGLHFHALCESDSHDLEKVLKNVEEKFGHLLPHVKFINMGGGHLMTRKGYDVDFLIELLTQFKCSYPNLEVILEPGSAFAWDTGYLVTRIVDIVENYGIKTAIINASFTCHMPDCLEMPYKPVILSASENGVHKYRIGGNSCLAGDYIGDWNFEEELKIGDVLVFNDMIHYTMVKTNTFNGIVHPSIAIWGSDEKLNVVRQFEYEDYKCRLS